jgi:IclR family acetate operon transcriptional repressor
MSSKIESKYNVPGLDRALSIIELLNKNPAGLSVNEIAHSLKYPLNSIYRIMMTLERRKYVRKQSGESVFVLSDKFLTLATPVAGEPAFIETAMPFMRDLRDDTMESVFAGVLVGNEGVVLEQCEGPPPIQFPDLSLVFDSLLHTAGTGKTFSWHTSETKKRIKIMEGLKLEKFHSSYNHHQRRVRKRSFESSSGWVRRWTMKKNLKDKYVWVLLYSGKTPN